HKNGFSTTTRTDLPTPQRQVALSKEVIELHKKKRIGTIKLLLEIVKEGTPRDARAAGVTALALEEDPAYALLWSYGSLESFDKAGANDLPTDRELLVDQVETALGKAETQSEMDRKQ